MLYQFTQQNVHWYLKAMKERERLEIHIELEKLQKQKLMNHEGA